ncbi:4Fe-4S dicluster domain-containing protein [Tessaracoccus sp.]
MSTRSPGQRLLDDHYFEAAQRWLHRLEAPSVALVCRGGSASPVGTKHRPAIEAPCCLHELPVHRLVDLWLTGVRDVATPANSCCGEDEIIRLHQSWNPLVREMFSLTTGAAVPGKWSWSLAPSRVPLDRRGLLGLSRRALPTWPTHDSADDDHARLLTALRAAGLTPLEQPAPGLALAASGCTACGVCVQACPHDALTLSINGTESSLVHAPNLCRGDQQCVTLCPVDALTVEGSPSWAEMIDGTPHVLATLEVAVCQRCRARFPAQHGSRLCDSCRIRRSNPFGSQLPAEAIEALRARSLERD